MNRASIGGISFTTSTDFPVSRPSTSLVMHDANFVCGDSRHRSVPPGQNFDPSGN
jgi:hypothetical protein